jgi:hypothetical protein
MSCKKDVCKHSGHESINKISSNLSVLFQESINIPLFVMYIREYRTDNNRQCSIRSRSSCYKKPNKTYFKLRIFF